MGLHQQLIARVSYPLILRKSGDSAILRYLREYERSQYLGADEIRDLQRRRLATLLDHAYRRCPFYRERFDGVGLVPSDIKELDDLRALPALEKCEIQEHRDRMVARDWPPDDLIADQTGGSTGSPLSFFLSHDRQRSRAAAALRHNRWAGWDIGDKVASIWGAPRDLPPDTWRHRVRNALTKRQMILDAGHLTEAKLAAFVEALNRFRPRVIQAYARAGALFARYVRSRGLSVHRPHSIVTSAEVLEPGDRVLLEEVFGCPVFNRYGCREVSVVASECEAHRGMHTMAEGLYLEIEPGPSGPGAMGAILVTDLLNHAMPLIRYRIGDMGAWEDEPCPCGRGLPRLREVAGRVTDFLVGQDRRLVSGVFLATYVVAQRPSLGQVQIHQEQAGEVLYRIRRGAGFREPEDLDYLDRTTRRHLGEGTAVRWAFVEEFPPTPSGKFLFSRSTAAHDLLISPVPEPDLT